MINFEAITLRSKITSRGGGLEIDLTSLGFPNEKMAVYQNYLGGGMLGRVCVNDTIRAKHKFVELSMDEELDNISDQLKQYFFNITNPEDCWESQSFEQNQNLPESAY